MIRRPWLRFIAATAATAILASTGHAAAAPWTRFVPFRLGDSWTYDWEVTEGSGPPRKLARTRVFDGTEFIGAGLAFKLVSDDGSYHLYTFDKEVLAIHASSEQGRLYFYDPPVVFVAPDFALGETRVVEHRDTGRTWKTTLIGLEDVTVPLGTFKGCLKMRLSMESAELTSEALQYFAPDVGLVAYHYELQTTAGRKNVIRIDARLRLARLSGTPIAKVADVAKLENVAADSSFREDESARDALRRAIDRRYTWDSSFPGFGADFEYREQGKESAVGKIFVARDLSVRILAPIEELRGVLRNEVSSFVSHRKDAPFDVTYGGTSFKKTATSPTGEIELASEGDATGVRHTVRGDELIKVERSVGRLRYVATYLKTLRTEGGRYIAVEYEIQFFSNEDGTLVSSDHVTDSYAKVEGYWLPTGRKTVNTLRGSSTTSIELRLTGHHYLN